MKNKQRNRLKLPELTICLVACLSIITLCYCAFFNYPSGDDYGCAYRILRDGLWSSFIDTYMSWSGRYAATAISFVNPFFVGGETWLFSVYSIVIILAFVGSIVFFVDQTLYGRIRTAKLIVCALLVCVIFAGMPSFFEAFYWFSAYISYVVPLILILVFLGLSQLYKRSSLYWNSLKKAIFCAISSIIVLIVNGCNELTVIIMDCIIVFLLFVEQEKKLFGGLFVVALISSIAMFAAPGNFARLTESNSHIDIVRVLLYGTSFSILFIVKNIPLLVGMSIVYIVLVAPIVGEKKEKMQIPMCILLLFVFGVIWLMNVFMFLSTDTKPLERTENVVFVFFVFSWAIILYNLIPDKLIAYLRSYGSSIFSYLALLLFLSFMCNYNSSMNATFADLFSGNIYQFAKERQEQIDLQKSSNTETTIVPALTVAPKTLTYTLYDDISKLSSVISPGEPIYGTQPIFENDTVRVQDSRMVWNQIKMNLKDKSFK